MPLFEIPEIEIPQLILSDFFQANIFMANDTKPIYWGDPSMLNADLVSFLFEFEIENNNYF